MKVFPGIKIRMRTMKLVNSLIILEGNMEWIWVETLLTIQIATLK